MNPLALIGWWKEILIALLVVALGIQSYRLQGAQGRVKVFEEREAAQKREQAYREIQAIKNKERTDAQYAIDLGRARAVGVRNASAPIVAGPAAITFGGEAAAGCVDGGRLASELAGFSGRLAERLNGAATEVLRRHADRLTGNAREGEEVAAAFRACAAFAVGLDGATK